LDDLKTETTYVRTNLAAIYKFWIEQAGFDGFRIDTVKHVDAGCWQYWCPQLHADAALIGKPNFFMFGECEDGSDAKVGSYTGIKAGGAYELDSEVDYPLYFMINGVFAQANANSKQI
jgi:glycosidase